MATRDRWDKGSRADSWVEYRLDVSREPAQCGRCAAALRVVGTA